MRTAVVAVEYRGKSYSAVYLATRMNRNYGTLNRRITNNCNFYEVVYYGKLHDYKFSDYNEYLQWMNYINSFGDDIDDLLDELTDIYDQNFNYSKDVFDKYLYSDGTYKTAREIAKLENIPINSVSVNLASPRIANSRKVYSNSKRILYHGKMRSINEVARLSGKSYVEVYNSINESKTPSKSFHPKSTVSSTPTTTKTNVSSTPKRKQKYADESLVYYNDKFLPVKEVSVLSGINEIAVKYRYTNNLDINTGDPLNTIRVGGEVMMISDFISKNFLIDASTVMSRYRDNLNILSGKRIEYIIYDDQLLSVHDVSKLVRLDEDKIRFMYLRGIKFSDKKGALTVSILGKRIPITTLSDKLGVPYASVLQRLKNNKNPINGKPIDKPFYLLMRDLLGDETYLDLLKD